MHGSVAEGGGRGAVPGMWLEGRLCSILTVMPGGDVMVMVRVRVRVRVVVTIKVRDASQSESTVHGTIEDSQAH